MNVILGIFASLSKTWENKLESFGNGSVTRASVRNLMSHSILISHAAGTSRAQRFLADPSVPSRRAGTAPFLNLFSAQKFGILIEILEKVTSYRRAPVKNDTYPYEKTQKSRKLMEFS